MCSTYRIQCAGRRGGDSKTRLTPDSLSNLAPRPQVDPKTQAQCRRHTGERGRPRAIGEKGDALHRDTSWNATLTVSTSSQELLAPEEETRLFATTAEHDPVELEAGESLFATCESSEGEGGSCHVLGLFVTTPENAGAWGCSGQAE